MSSEKLKLFAKFAGNREQFENTEYPATYENSIVFIDGIGDETKNCIYTHGEYYGTSAAVDDLIDKMSNPIPVTHEELVDLRNNSQLVGGVRYVITDYVTDAPSGTSDGLSYSSMMKPFNIIVAATSCNSLCEECFAVSNGDFPNADKWKLYYTVNARDDRFDWYNEKGIIYRLIDENNVDCPYDFKNIMFKRYNVGNVTVEGDDEYLKEIRKEVANILLPWSQYKDSNKWDTYGKVKSTSDSSCYLLTFPDYDNYMFTQTNTIMKPFYRYGVQWLNNNIFYEDCNNVYIGENCRYNTFRIDSQSIPIGCHDMIIRGSQTLLLYDGCNHNVIDDCSFVKLGCGCRYNYITSSDIELSGSNCNCVIDNATKSCIGYGTSAVYMVMVDRVNVAPGVCDGTYFSECYDVSYNHDNVVHKVVQDGGKNIIGGKSMYIDNTYEIDIKSDVKIKGSVTINDKTLLVETIPVMYWELMDMCTNGSLVPGQTYKILDYECNDSYYYFTHDLYIKYRSRHNIYSIIVTAVSTSTLSHEATLVIDNAYSSYVGGVSGIGEFDDVEVVDDGVAEVSDETKTLYAYDTYKVKYITHSDQRYKDSAFTVLNNDDVYIPTVDGYKNDQYFLFEGKEKYNYSGAVYIRQEQNSSFEYIKTLYYCTGVNAGFDYSNTLLDGKVLKADVYIFRELNGTRELGVTIKSIDRDGTCRECQVSYNNNTGKYAQTGGFSSCLRPYTDGLPYMKKYNSSSYESALFYFPEIETKRQHGVIYELKDSFGNSFPYDVLSISQIDYKHNVSDGVPHIGGKLPIKVSDYMVNTTVGPYVARYNDGTDTKYYNLPVATIITDDMDERYCNIMVINTSHFDLVSNSMYVNNVKIY